MAGILKVDTIQNANASTLITQANSTTITIGTSGQTVALASGASSSGFGATYNGAVNWDTTPKTTTVTAASGVGYFINTTSGGITVNLPAGSAGAIVALSDYAATWNTNAVTVNANGSEKIGGVAASASLNTQGQAVTFIYVDSTQGWTNVGDATKVTGNAFVAATGGTVTTCGNCKIHTFTGPGTFTVTSAGTPTGSNSVQYLVVAGGGGGGSSVVASSGGGGGGAGGFRQNYPSPATAGLPVTAQAYPITVGAGGAGGTTPSCANAKGTSGANSVFSTITSTGGGGGGGSGNNPNSHGIPGGSGGGAGAQGCVSMPGGTGNSPPVSPPQGNNGGGSNVAAPNYGSGGGGGAGAGGGAGSPTAGGAGGAGTANSISGSSVTRAGGGGGGTYRGGTVGAGGSGGGGAGGSPPVSGAVAGTANTGGGGGGMAESTGASGGSGIVIIRYKFQ